MQIVARSGDWLVTRGLAAVGMPELAIHEPRSDWQDDARYLLRSTGAYVVSSGNRIRAGETMNYGFWLVKFLASERSELVVHEYDEAGAKFILGARLAMEFWRHQHHVCKGADAAFHPPRPDLLAAVSPDLAQADRVEGVRYKMSEHMSGWIITSLGYDGPVESLLLEHLLHFVQSRRDLIRYLALPIGYRFFVDGEASTRFDPGVAAAE